MNSAQMLAHGQMHHLCLQVAKGLRHYLCYDLNVLKCIRQEMKMLESLSFCLEQLKFS